MTGGSSHPEGEEAEEPVIAIQPDWDDSLFTSKREVWITCKFRGKDGIHSKLRYHPPNTFTSDDFTVTSFKRNSLSLKHNDSGSSCTFIPPSQVLPNVHSKNIVSIDANEGELGVSVCSDNNLIVWNTKTGSTLCNLTGHVANVYKCKFFPSGVVILSGGADMQMKIWCAKTGVCPVTLIGHKAAVNDFCIVDKGRNVISVSKDGSARLWDCGKAECLGVIFQSSDVLNCCAISSMSYESTEDREVPLSDREVGTREKVLVIGSEEGYVYGVAVYNRKVLFTTNVNSAVNVILMNNDQFIVGCQNGKIEVFTMKGKLKKLKCYFESNSPILSGCLFKNDYFVMGRNDGTVNCYKFEMNARHRIILTGSDCDPVYSIASNDSEIYTACRDAKIRKYLIDEIV